MSSAVPISAGVRQGGVLSPYLFAAFVDDVLGSLKKSSLGCRFRGMLINAIMYADDLLLMSLSLHDLQAMVNLCVKEFEAIGLSVNISKSACLRIGPSHNKPIENVTINGNAIEWMTELRYLGVTFLKSPSFKCNLQIVRQKYFKALNGIFGKIGANSSVTVTLSLINSCYTPILLYGIEALNVSSSVYNVLKAAYTATFF